MNNETLEAAMADDPNFVLPFTRANTPAAMESIENVTNQLLSSLLAIIVPPELVLLLFQLVLVHQS